MAWFFLQSTHYHNILWFMMLLPTRLNPDNHLPHGLLGAFGSYIFSGEAALCKRIAVAILLLFVPLSDQQVPIPAGKLIHSPEAVLLVYDSKTDLQHTAAIGGTVFFSASGL